MDRRKFLKAIGLGGAAAVVAPTAVLKALAPPPLGPIEKIAQSPDGLNHWSSWSGDWEMMDGGELDIGVARDSLARQNEFTIFSESFHGITSLGPIRSGDCRIKVTPL